jgi:HAD superfamily phosphoserine phosphatase-like hydrolase
MKAAILFDFDSTLTKTDTIKFLLLSLSLASPLSGLKMMIKHYRQLKSQAAVKHMVISSLIIGKTSRQVVSALWLYKILVSKSLHSSLVKKLNNHDQRVIIASASPSFALENVVALGGAKVIATEYEIINGRYSGKILGEICYGKEKLRRVNVFLQKEHVDKVVEA